MKSSTISITCKLSRKKLVFQGLFLKTPRRKLHRIQFVWLGRMKGWVSPAGNWTSHLSLRASESHCFPGSYSRYMWHVEWNLAEWVPGSKHFFFFPLFLSFSSFFFVYVFVCMHVFLSFFKHDFYIVNHHQEKSKEKKRKKKRKERKERKEKSCQLSLQPGFL